MVELVFVIVILGILASIAIPRFAASRSDAEVAKIRSDVAAVRSAIINERQLRLFRGQRNFVATLDDGATAGASGEEIFGDDGNAATGILLQYPIITKALAGGGPAPGHWIKSGNNTYQANAGGAVATFTYNPVDGTFDCNHADTACINIMD